MVFENFDFSRDRLETIKGKEISRDVQVFLKPASTCMQSETTLTTCKIIHASFSSHEPAPESWQALLADLVQG